MILIADSGSTKTDWVIVEKGKIVEEFKSDGLNPYFVSDEQINEILLKTFHCFSSKSNISKVYFYGAGCNAKMVNSRIEKSLKKHFVNAEIFVESDMLGAAISLFQKNKGVAVILGTGSNSCFYDGSKIVKQVGSFGFILGDEGSGSNIGKRFIQAYLNNELPKDIATKFYTEFKLEAADIIDNVYRKDFPNRFLASFTKFVAENIENQFLQEIVKNSFRDLFKRKLLKYEFTEINFVGSVAFYFSDLLNQVAKEFNITVGKIEKSPMKGLIESIR